MAGFYHKYQAEILAAVSIFAAIVLAIVSDVKLLRPITHYGLFVVFGAYVIASLAVDKRLRTQRDRFNSTSLHRISPPSDNAYRAVLAALKEVIQDAGIQAFNILYIGDRAEDRIVAEATGTRFCSIDHKTPPGQGDSSSVRSFDELAGTIYDIEVTAGLRTL